MISTYLHMDHLYASNTPKPPSRVSKIKMDIYREMNKPIARSPWPTNVLITCYLFRVCVHLVLIDLHEMFITNVEFGPGLEIVFYG